MTPINFDITEGGIDPVTSVISVAGDLDLQAAPDLRDLMIRLIDSGKTSLVVDLSETMFIDSTAIGVLIARARHLENLGGRLAVVCDDPSLLRTLEITGVDRALTICGSVLEALSALIPSSGTA